MVDNAINRALINHSNVLSNTVYNAVARTFKEGQTPPLYAGLVYHQPGLSLVTASSAPLAVAGTEATSPPSTLGLTNGQSTLMRPNPTTSQGRVPLNIDLSASAKLGSVFQNCQVPTNWWRYGMPLEFFANSSGTSHVTDLAGKALMTSVLGILNVTTRLNFLILITVPKLLNLSLMPLKPSCHPQHDMKDAVLKYAIALLNK